ncbi:MAG: O-antigen ligase C-terminal domain-containing protein, partial [Burkholderiales bacterium]|nr:O-antigen ligase C-terminal domain-containing protein [Burkholderiales bacterium]
TSACLSFALGTLGTRESRWYAPELAWMLAALAAWLLLQCLLREPAFTQLPLSGAVFLLVAALSACLGLSLVQRLGAQAVIRAFAWASLAGALLNASIALLQTFGMPGGLEWLLAPPSGPRPVGHVGQSNLLATYLALGAISLLYLHERRELATPAALALGLLLATGAATTHSRTALLYPLWVALLASGLWLGGGRAWTRLALGAWLQFLATAGAAALLVTLQEHLALPAKTLALVRIAGELTREIRPALWVFALRLSGESPWLGVGWGEFAGAAFRHGIPSSVAAESTFWSSPHNLFLHVLVEAGIPGALIAVLAALGWWLAAAGRLRKNASPQTWWAIAFVGVLFLHSLLEYPLWYAHVLFPFALVAGTVCRAPRALAGRAWGHVTAAAAGILLALLAWTLIEHQRFASAFAPASGRTLAPVESVQSARATLEEIARGPLGAMLAPWIYYAAPIDPTRCATGLSMGRRVLRVRPDAGLIARHAVTLAACGERQGALSLLRLASGYGSASQAAIEAALGEIASSPATGASSSTTGAAQIASELAAWVRRP